MILAAALSAEGREPPDDLELLWKWRYFGLPPRNGGQLDQTAGQLQRMTSFQKMHDLWEIYIKRPADWLNRLSGQWVMIEYVAWLIVLRKPEDYEISGGIRELARLYINRILKGDNGNKDK